MKFVNKKLATACILSVMCAGFSSLGYAAEEKTQKEEIQSFALDEYVVTANRTEQTIFNANANISVVTSADIERMHYDTLEDVLRTMTNIQFLNYGLPGYNMNKIRINGSEEVIVLIDGVRATMMGTGQQYPFHLISDMDNVERIEVLKGAAAVLYGSDAKGGVINIITKKDATPKTKITVSGGSFDKEEYNVSTEGKVGDLTYRVFGQKQISGNYEDGAGVEWNAHDNSENVGIMIKQDFAPGSNIILNYTHGNEDYYLYDPYQYTPQEIKGFAKSKRLQITYNQKISNTLSNSFSLSNSRYENRGMLKGDYGYSQFWGNHYRTISVQDTLTKEFGNTHVVVTGYEYVKSTELDLAKNWTTKEYYTREMKNKSFFLQDQWTFDDKWKLTSGVRYDAPKGGLVDIDSNLSKSFNLGYTFDDNTNMYIAYNDYFVLPSMYQLYNTKYGNDKLLPEKGKNYEVGLNHMIDESTMLSAHYFNRNSEQNIGFSTDSNTYVNDSEKAHGFDIQLDKQFNEYWNVNVGYSRLSSRIKTRTDGNGYLPKNLVTLGVTYTKDKWDIGLDGKGFIGRDGDDVKSEGWPTDRYWVFNIGLNYKADDNIKMFAKCNNIFNQEYAEQTQAIWWGGEPGEWYGMPGRSFVAGVEVSF